jgi:hypothetical protein
MRKHQFTLEISGPEGKIKAIAEYLENKGFDSKLVSLIPGGSAIKLTAVNVQYE